MIHLPIVDKKVTELMNNKKEYVVGIGKERVDFYVYNENSTLKLFPYIWVFDKDKIEFVSQLINNKHFVDLEDIEVIKTCFDVNDGDIKRYNEGNTIK